jgi:sialic acid synthase SpsE
MFSNNGKPYIIGETAYNHEGDVEYLLKMIDEISEIGLDAVKFHLLLNPSSYMVKDHPVMKQLTQWIFSKDEWIRIFQHAKDKNLDIIALCDDLESLQFVLDHYQSIKAVEIHSSGLNDFFMLKKVVNFKGFVILGIGGSSLDEIQFAIESLKAHGKEEILLMYGFQSFPTNYNDVNLSKMIIISDLFGLPVGYADHTAYDDINNEFVSSVAMMLGVPVLEKHVTLDPGVDRIDYHAAVGKDQLRRIKELMDVSYEILGDGSLGMSEAELKYGNTGPMKKAIVAKHKIHKGDLITQDDISFKRTLDESPIGQKEILRLFGLKAKNDIEVDEIIDFSKVKYCFQHQDLKSLGLKEK